MPDPIEVRVIDVRVVDLKPDDRIAVQLQTSEPHEILVRIQQQLQAQFPGRRVLVLTDGAQLEVLRTVQPEEPR